MKGDLEFISRTQNDFLGVASFHPTIFGNTTLVVVPVLGVIVFPRPAALDENLLVFADLILVAILATLPPLSLAAVIP